MIPFSPPKIYQEMIDEVTDTLRSGWITTGPKTKLFEKELTAYCGNKKTICVNSATIGMELMLRWYGVKEGDEVILPAYTYCSTANVVIHCGATPVLVDARDDFNVDIGEIKKKITPRTKVIIPVDIGGLPSDYICLQALLEEAEVLAMFQPENEQQRKLGRPLLMSDAAHSLGALYEGKHLGTQSDVTVFSFHAVKNLTTAEGGAIALNLPDGFDHEAIYSELNRKSLHGQSKDALSKSQKGNWRYDVKEAGYKANMTDIQASLGLVELRRYDTETIPRRKAIFEQYDAFFKQFAWAQLPLYADHGRLTSFHLYMLRINGVREEQRDRIMQGIFEREVSVNVHFQPLPLLSFYADLGYKMEDYPVAFDNYSREISLPVYYDLTDEQIATVCNAVKEAVEEVIG